MGAGASHKQDTETNPSSQSNAEGSDSADFSRRPPIILITAPSREDIYASGSKLTIAQAVKERRPSSAPFVVGRKLIRQ